MMINRKKYIYKTYLRDVNKYEYNFFEDTDNNCYISIKKILEIENPFYSQEDSNLILIANNYFIIDIYKRGYMLCILELREMNV